MKVKRDRQTAVFLVGAIVASHWLGLLPIAHTGAWQNHFFPVNLSGVRSVFFMILPLAIMGLLFWFGKRLTWLWLVQVLYSLAAFAFTKPQMETIAKELKISVFQVMFVAWQPYAYTFVSTVVLMLVLSKYEKLRGMVFREIPS